LIDATLALSRDRLLTALYGLIAAAAVFSPLILSVLT
jgi:hypothetical protein